jgi:hypothetical protein
MTRTPVNLAHELRKAQRPVAHACGPDCFTCLVTAYARTVKRRRPIYAPTRKYGRKK